MKFRIHNSHDWFDVEGDSIESVQEQAREEVSRRGWVDCWSQQLDDGE